jgi:hypothetical protein
MNFYFHDDTESPNPNRKPLLQVHIRSLCSGLFHVKQNLIYVLNSLQRFDDESEWGIYEDKVAHNLVAGTIIL